MTTKRADLIAGAYVMALLILTVVTAAGWR